MFAAGDVRAMKCIHGNGATETEREKKAVKLLHGKTMTTTNAIALGSAKNVQLFVVSIRLPLLLSFFFLCSFSRRTTFFEFHNGHL